MLLEKILFEAPIDVWIKKFNPNEEEMNLAQKLFLDFAKKYSSLLDSSVKDLTTLNLSQLTLLHEIISLSKQKNLSATQIQWLTKQYRNDLNLTIKQIKEDYIPVLQTLQKNKNKFKSDFLDKINSVEELNFELNKIITNDEFAVSEKEFDKIAERGGWAVYMPHSTEASCELGKTNGQRDTTWCTQRPDGGNLFLQYSLQGSIILFYVIKNNTDARIYNFAKMSIGFVRGQPKFNQGRGGITVDAKNNNLTLEQFQEVLGVDLANYFLSAMQQKANSLEGKHPAEKEFEKLLNKPKELQQKLDSFAKDENGEELRDNFIDMVLEKHNVPDEALIVVVNNLGVGKLFRLAKENKSEKVLDHILAKTITSKKWEIRQQIAKNRFTSIKNLEILSKDPIEPVREAVAENIKTPLNILMSLAQDSDDDTRASIANRSKLPINIINTLATDTSEKVIYFLAKNEATPSEILSLIAKKDWPNQDLYNVYKGIAQNINTPKETLEKIMDNEYNYSASKAAYRTLYNLSYIKDKNNTLSEILFSK